MKLNNIERDGFPYLIWGDPASIPDIFFDILQHQSDIGAVSAAQLPPWEGQMLVTPFLNPSCTLMRQDAYQSILSRHPTWNFFDHIMDLMERGMTPQLLCSSQPFLHPAEVTDDFFRSRQAFYEKWSYRHILVQRDPYGILDLVPFMDQNVSLKDIRTAFIQGKGSLFLASYLKQSYPHIQIVEDLSRPVDLVVLHHELELQSNPWTFLKEVAAALTSKGHVICTIANVRYILTFLDLLQGSWPSHQKIGATQPNPQLHFFTREAMVTLLSESQLEVKEISGIQHQLSEELNQVIHILKKTHWPMAGIIGDGTVSHFFFWAIPHTPIQPLPIDGLRNYNLLIKFDYQELEIWQPLLLDYLRKIPADADVACVLNISHMPWTESQLLAYLENMVQDAGLNLEEIPDLVLLAQEIPEMQIPALLQSVNGMLMAGKVTEEKKKWLEQAVRLKRDLLLTGVWKKENPPVRLLDSFQDIL